MKASQVRQRILREHRTLREHLQRLESEVDALARDNERLESVSRMARALLVELEAHTELEDRLLVPALRALDAWGPIRASMLLRHHKEQREQLQSLLAAVDDSQDPIRVAQITLQLIVDVRADMFHEETVLLSRALLRDAPKPVEIETE
jgi:iron-sulfur cluster repair protein YtfE (RIC family)